MFANVNSNCPENPLNSTLTRLQWFKAIRTQSTPLVYQIQTIKLIHLSVGHDKSCDKTSVRVYSQMDLSWFIRGPGTSHLTLHCPADVHMATQTSLQHALFGMWSQIFTISARASVKYFTSNSIITSRCSRTFLKTAFVPFQCHNRCDQDCQYWHFIISVLLQVLLIIS